MKDKKGLELMGGRVINYIIAAIVIVLIVYLGIRLWNLSGESKIQRASEQMEVIEAVMKIARERNIPRNFEIFPPVNWYLRTFSNNDFPTGYCNSRGDIGCLCFCDKLECYGRNYCKGFGFKVQVIGVHEGYEPVAGNVAGGSYSNYKKTEGVLKLGEIEKLTVFKEGEIIKIKRIENAG